MALFQRKKAPLARLKDRDWNGTAERAELFREIESLEEIKIDEIIWALSAEEPDVRKFSARLFERFKGQEGTGSLFLAQLKDKNEVQQTFILQVFAKTSPSDAEKIGRSFVSDKNPAKRKLGMQLLFMLPIEISRPFAIGVLKNKGKKYLIPSLNKLSEDTEILKNPIVRDVLKKTIEDKDEAVRSAAYRMLKSSTLKETEIKELLINGILDESYSIRQIALQGASRHVRSGDQEIEKLLINLLSDGRATVRTSVISLLLQSPDKIRVIRGYLNYTRVLAGWIKDRALASLKQFADEIIDVLIELMRDKDQDIRLQALVVASSFLDNRCVPSIIELLKDKDWWVRITAAETLGLIGDKKATQALIESLNDNDVRWAAVEALARLKDPSSANAIAKYLGDPAEEIRLSIIEALAVFESPKVIPPLENRAKKDNSRKVRTRAVELIRDICNKTGHTIDMKKLEQEALRTHMIEEYNEVERLLVKARNAKASDLHINVGLPPLLRIHGRLIMMDDEKTLGPDDTHRLLNSILTDMQKESLINKLQLDFCHVVNNVGRYRANVYLQRLGYSGVFRVIPSIPPTLEELGMPENLKDLINYNQGIVLVAGPSGSGKSTTLASFINLINENKKCHVISIEDPIEFVHPMKNSLVNQRELDKHTKSYASALRAALREDPDVVVVGELRDQETTRMALEAAETGHLVITTLNTTSASKTVDRVIEQFPPDQQPQIRTTFSESLKAVISQNLLPRKDTKGRVACFEILLTSTNVRGLIRDEKTHQLPIAIQTGKVLGMQTLDSSLMKLVKNNLIDGDKAYMRANKKEDFEPFVHPSFLQAIKEQEQEQRDREAAES